MLSKQQVKQSTNHLVNRWYDFSFLDQALEYLEIVIADADTLDKAFFLELLEFWPCFWSHGARVMYEVQVQLFQAQLKRSNELNKQSKRKNGLVQTYLGETVV